MPLSTSGISPNEEIGETYAEARKDARLQRHEDQMDARQL